MRRLPPETGPELIMAVRAPAALRPRGRARGVRAARCRGDRVLPEHQVPPAPRPLLHGRVVLELPDADRRRAQPVFVPDPGATRDAHRAAERVPEREGRRLLQHRLALPEGDGPPLDVRRRAGRGEGDGHRRPAPRRARSPPRLGPSTAPPGGAALRGCRPGGRRRRRSGRGRRPRRLWDPTPRPRAGGPRRRPPGARCARGGCGRGSVGPCGRAAPARRLRARALRRRAGAAAARRAAGLRGRAGAPGPGPNHPLHGGRARLDAPLRKQRHPRRLQRTRRGGSPPASASAHRGRSGDHRRGTAARGPRPHVPPRGRGTPARAPHRRGRGAGRHDAGRSRPCARTDLGARALLSRGGQARAARRLRCRRRLASTDAGVRAAPPGRGQDLLAARAPDLRPRGGGRRSHGGDRHLGRG